MRDRLKWKDYSSTLIIMSVGIIFSVAASITVKKWEDAEIQLSFDAASRERGLFIEEAFRDKIAALKAVRSFYNASEMVTREEFGVFVGSLLENIKGMQALSWVPRVTDGRRARYEEAARQDGIEGFNITERARQGHMARAENRGEYFPVYFIEPYEGNEKAAGFDLASNPVRLEALATARDTGKATATGRITLVQEEEDQYGFLIFLPIYKRGVPVNTVPARQNNLIGFVSGVFRVGDIVESALASLEPKQINISLHDRTGARNETLLYYHRSRSLENRSLTEDGNADGRYKQFNYKTTFGIGGRSWEVSCSPVKGFISKNTIHRLWYPWAILAGGLLLTGALTLFLSSVVGQAVRTERLVEQRTHELNESEAKLSGILSAMTDIVCLINDEHRIVWANKPAMEFFGKDIVGGQCRNIYHCGKDEHGMCVGNRAFSNGETHESESETSDKDGNRRVFWTTSSVASTYDDGKVKTVIEIFRDITERKEAEEKIKEAARVKSEFTSIVSHELRTPLTAIKEGIAIVSDGSSGPVNEEQADFLDTAKRNVDRLARLINDVLDYQKLDADRMKYSMEENDINPLVEEIVETMRPALRDKDIEFSLHLADGLPKAVFDRDKIAQVLTNLINNAIKFTDKGFVTITTEKSEIGIQTSVKDTGVGIKEEDMNKLFESFSQIVTEKGRKTGGTGLGLAISKKIIEHHGGKIWTESEYGKGTMFSFVLPLGSV